MKAGCDLNCGTIYLNLLAAVESGLIDEETINKSVIRLMVSRLKLGILDNQETPYNSITIEMNDTKENNELSLLASKRCLALLENKDFLPLDLNNYQKIAVVGPNADSISVLNGNYSGIASKYYTVLEGIKEYCGNNAEIIYTQGCHIFSKNAEDNDLFNQNVALVKDADVIIVCIGLNPEIEGEAGDAYNSDAGGDKIDLELPGLQNELIRQMHSTGKPMIVISLSGSAVNLSIAKENANAVIQAWYPGAQGGKAIAELIFGEFSPSGRLPVTYYNSVDDLPDFEDYSMIGRTYRYFEKDVLYPFGYGLSYTKFRYSDLSLDKKYIDIGESILCTASVTNLGLYDSDEVVQLYLKDNVSTVRCPRYQLKGFKRVLIKAGETKQVSFTIKPSNMELVLDNGKSVIEPGNFTVFLGGSQPDNYSIRLTGGNILQDEFTVKQQIKYQE